VTFAPYGRRSRWGVRRSGSLAKTIKEKRSENFASKFRDVLKNFQKGTFFKFFHLHISEKLKERP
jgi:hypothetical protein